MKNKRPVIDRVIRSKRKTFGLEVRPNGNLIVRAPNTASQAQIDAVVERKAGWIKSTRIRLAQEYPGVTTRQFIPGETFWYLGEQYTLSLIDRQRPPLELEGCFRLSRHAQDRARSVFIDWYREETRAITHDLINDYTRRFGFRVNQVRITSARTRWGSCSGKNNLNFTYRLSMAPLKVIEYVVVHELAHLKVRNHSRSFWDTVARIKPDYHQNRAWLKQYGPLLTLD